MFSARHSGSRGTDTSRWPAATRAISATVRSGSGTCSSDLDRGHEVELAVGEGRRPAGMVLNSRFGAPASPIRPASFGSSRSMPTTRPVAEPLRPPLGEHALAAADVEHRAGRRAGEQLVERALEAGHQPADDRVGRAVLVERVAGRDRGRLAPAARRAHTSSASRSARLAAAGAASGAAPGS